MADYTSDGLTACRMCDSLHVLTPIPPRSKAFCQRCGNLLYQHLPHSLDRACALYLTAFILFLLTNAFPLVSLQVGDRSQQTLFASAGLALQTAGMSEIGLLVMLTSVICPLLTLGGMLYLLLPLRLGIRPPQMARVWRMIHWLNPWSLIGVFMLGLLVSIAKLQDLAVVVPGIAFYALIALLVVSAAATACFDPSILWPQVGPSRQGQQPAGDDAHQHGYSPCPVCELLVPLTAARTDCPRCGSHVHGIDNERSLATTWALLISAAMLLIPANLYPVMTVSRFGFGEPSTILSGVIHLIQDGAWPLGLLVFFASFVVPVSKILVLAFLLYRVKQGRIERKRDHTRLYQVVEAVGAWSMVDIFLVGILVALVRLDGLASVTPGLGATFFGASVVLTMIAAHHFDPRLIWHSPASAGTPSRE